MKKINFVLIALIVFAACKKSNPPTTTAGGTPITNSTITPSHDSTFYGHFFYIKNQGLSTSPTHSVYTNYSAEAYFTATPQKGHYNIITIGSVLLNNIALSPPQYLLYNITDTTCSWNVTGNTIIPSFAYTSNSIKPKYANYNLLPDTIDRSVITSIPFTVTNADSVFVSISGTTCQIGSPHLTGVTSATFQTTLLSNLAIGTGTLYINSVNYDIEEVNGKAMKFEYDYQFQKSIYIK